MELKDIMSVTGKSGLYVLRSNRKDGLIVTKLGENKNIFLSSRKYMFTPLENIGVYNLSGDTVELGELLRRINTISKRVPDTHASEDEMVNFFKEVMSDYDPDRVYKSDIKKILSWYKAMRDNNALDVIPDGREEE